MDNSALPAPLLGQNYRKIQNLNQKQKEENSIAPIARAMLNTGMDADTPKSRR